MRRPIMTLDHVSDSELVQRFRDGDAGAFDALVRRYQDQVCRMAAVWLYDAQHTTDVAQEVFLRGFKGFKRFRFKAAPFTWLYRTTRNVCHEFNRKRRGEPLDHEPPDPAANPEQEVARYDAARQVRALVAVLPQRQREVVLLRIFEGLSVRDTAAAMSCREGTVKALLHKATARLRLDYTEREVTA